jgi:hypothetical protein
MGKNILINEKGVALIIALIILLVLTLIGINAISTTTFETSLSGNERVAIDAFYAAEAGIQRGIGQLRADNTNPPIARTPLGQGSSESYYQSTTVYLAGRDGQRPGYSIDAGEQGFKFRFYQVNGKGDSFGAMKEIEVQVSLPIPAQ